VLDTDREVIRCLITYTDWWQPTTSSVMQVGKARPDKNLRDGLNPGIIDTLDERTELCRRMAQMHERDRHLLFLWYVKQLHVDDIATSLNLSRRHCFRRRAAAVRQLVDLGVQKAA
jgi:hypothetical protein